MKLCSKRECFHIYFFCIQFLGAICFYFGFFPGTTSSDQFSTTGELPDMNNTDVFSFKKHYDKFVLIVIDALRHDFIADETGEPLFPYLSRKVNKKLPCLLKARVQTPTVTLPRIKSILTGTVPGFVDVVANFGKSELTSDNFIAQANSAGLRTVFYGDETWINLLPGAFIRSEGTSSFFVSDFTEVDENVTRNVEKELHRNDWDLMILHYLGLDHIGHLEGPRSKLVKPKLLEMDKVIASINEHFLLNNENALVLICGDHGMKDSGGHGGNSYAEIFVPVVLLNYDCDTVDIPEINQIDIAPLISVLLGLPIPSDSIGQLNHVLLSGIDRFHALYAMYYNTKRLVQKSTFYNLDETESTNFTAANFAKAVEFHKNFLKTQHYIDYLNSAKYFSLVQATLSEKLVKINVSFNDLLMIFGMSLFLQSVFASLFGHSFCFAKFQIKITLLFSVLMVSLHYSFCYLSQSVSTTCTYSFLNISCILVLYLILNSNVFLVKYLRKFQLLETPLSLPIICVTVLHTASLMSSSFIEEEHQSWYFLLVTICLIALRKNLSFGVVLVCHRLLRYLNQTGDKWASQPDFSDWFSENNSFYLLTFSASCLSITSLISSRWFTKNSLTLKILTLAQYLFIFANKITSGSIRTSIFEPSQYLGVLAARCFWMFTFLKILTVFKSFNSRNKSRNELYYELTCFALELTISVIFLLYKAQNLIIIPALMFYSYTFARNFKNDTIFIICSHYWLGTVFYFYQGNSNSLSSIDVAAGYVGLESYNFYLTALFIALNTYAAQVIAFLLMLKILAETGEYRASMSVIVRMYTLIFGLVISVYSILMTIQRHHLFIWSVFAPKLLYILANIVLNVILITLALLIAILGWHS